MFVDLCVYDAWNKYLCDWVLSGGWHIIGHSSNFKILAASKSPSFGFEKQFEKFLRLRFGKENWEGGGKFRAKHERIYAAREYRIRQLIKFSRNLTLSSRRFCFWFFKSVVWQTSPTWPDKRWTFTSVAFQEILPLPHNLNKLFSLFLQKLPVKGIKRSKSRKRTSLRLHLEMNTRKTCIDTKIDSWDFFFGLRRSNM